MHGRGGRPKGRKGGGRWEVQRGKEGLGIGRELSYSNSYGGADRRVLSLHPSGLPGLLHLPPVEVRVGEKGGLGGAAKGSRGGRKGRKRRKEGGRGGKGGGGMKTGAEDRFGGGGSKQAPKTGVGLQEED